MIDAFIHVILTIFFPPLLLGVITRMKAIFAGRRGAPLLQPYYDILRLMRKGSVFSTTTTWVFRAGPLVTLCSILTASLMIPLGHHPPPISFAGDVILFAYLFGLARFFTTVSALDTGSSFEGMGAAREVTFSTLAEPTLFFAVITLARLSHSLSLSEILTFVTPQRWLSVGACMILLTVALFIVLLAENCRIPFDDPTTHLELTMIHEVMVLDHSGPLFGAILYGASVKLFVLSALFVDVAFPFTTGSPLLDWPLLILKLLVTAIAIGVVESVMARLRLVRVPQLLVGATILSAFALLLILR
ncbi:MAG: NADH-quinone oxidoreductase subunit H [Desulfuromonadia bacterium]